MFNKLCIIGVGLIGGSIARAAKTKGLCQSIVGYGRPEDLPNLQTAKRSGVIDEYHLTLAEAVADADCVVIATPVGALESILTMLKPTWNDQAIYTDVGSTKASVTATASLVFGEVPFNLVPAHPIAGAEQSGVESAVADLFYNKRLIITPAPSTNLDLVKKIQGFWECMGAKVVIMDANHHDAILAATSHLPHILAFALVDMLGHKDEQTEIFQYAAGGFKDFTRIASSDPTMWLDICMANKAEIIPLIEQLKAELGKIQHYLQHDEHQKLFDTFKYSGQARQRFLDLYEN